MAISSVQKSQFGASLIAMMIGLLVSMMSILAVMTMHKSLVQVTVESKRDSIHDGLVNSVLVQLQTALHNAGFGMESTVGDYVVVGSSVNTPSLYWRFEDGGPKCMAVFDRSYTDADTGNAGRHLVMASVSNGCSESADLSALDWSNGTESTLATFKNHSTPLFNFSVRQQVCAPYGFGDVNAPEEHVLVDVVADSSSTAYQNGASISDITYTYCLANTHFN